MTLPFPLLNFSPYDESTIFSARNFDAGKPGMRNWLSVDGVFALLSVWFTMMENVPLPMYGTLQHFQKDIKEVVYVYLMITCKEGEEKKRNQIYQISHIFFSESSSNK